MIRPARHADTFPLVDMLVDKCARSIYAERGVAVDQIYARKLLGQFVQRHGGKHAGSTCLFVAENRKGVICGFVAGMLDRIYSIGDRLVAQDVFLVTNEQAPAITPRALVASYIEWAESNPAVAQIDLSYTDILPEGPRTSCLYERFGFNQSGKIYRKFIETLRLEEAA